MKPQTVEKRPQISDDDAARTRRAIIAWRDAVPPTSREEIAVACRRSLSTVDRWVKGTSEPTVSDIRHMEAFKPGIVEALFRRRPNGHARA